MILMTMSLAKFHTNIIISSVNLFRIECEECLSVNWYVFRWSSLWLLLWLRISFRLFAWCGMISCKLRWTVCMHACMHQLDVALALALTLALALREGPALWSSKHTQMKCMLCCVQITIIEAKIEAFCCIDARVLRLCIWRWDGIDQGTPSFRNAKNSNRIFHQKWLAHCLTCYSCSVVWCRCSMLCSFFNNRTAIYEYLWCFDATKLADTHVIVTRRRKWL